MDRLRARAKDFEPFIRDRLIAGALVPAPLINKAQKFRRWYRERVLELFTEVDAIIAPATPCVAPLIGQQTLVVGNVELPLRANVGIYTQPISLIGLPVVAVPVPLRPLPLGVQIIAGPWRALIAVVRSLALGAPDTPATRPATGGPSDSGVGDHRSPPPPLGGGGAR